MEGNVGSSTGAFRGFHRLPQLPPAAGLGHLSAFARPDAAKPMAANILFGGLGSWQRPHIFPASGSYPRALSPLGLSSPAPSDFPVPQCASQDVILAGPAYCNGVPHAVTRTARVRPSEFSLTRGAILVG